MSLVPLLFSDWWNDLDRPHSLFDQHFGLSLDPKNVISPSRSELVLYKPNRLRLGSRFHPYNLLKRNRGSSTLTPDKDKFLVTLDVQQFHPEEISVKIVDDNVIVEGKHQEKEDEHGWISRQFTRKYQIPSQCNIEQVESHLSSDGVLTITAPKKELPKSNSNEKTIKIQLTGQPALLPSRASTAEESNSIEPGQRGKKPAVKAA
ncbi:protein lethal(2)essential for life-like [Phymastichus coffea]|uniref:protein lethal(2)essential for life-like n=1 Tax=Phymastichus coffea TaxID=108790 RepID=UPI00273B1D24|nr:protein lethal(2)essential for life-like [Phymastichus coffea]